MKCPNCGLDLVDGFLYCTSCGEEIRIVPDFEPEIESQMDETLSTLLVEMAQEEMPLLQEETEEPPQKSDVLKKRFVRIICAVLILAFLSAAAITGYFIYRSNSFSFQMQKSEEFAKLEKYDEAIRYLEKAYEIDKSNVDTLFLMANYYYVQGKYDFAIYSLSQILEYKDLYIVDDIEKAYEEIIGIYSEQGSYKEINELLISSDDETIRDMFQKYLAYPPEFSYKEGSYEEVIPLKLSANTSGKIYYTLDGSTPNENSKTYMAPIFLETGNYQVNAFFVNDYGIKSEIATANYQIDLPIPAAPEVTIYSGDYNTPQMIQVEVPEGSEVYYTMNNTVPTIGSPVYTAPIPMPLGKSTFQFILVSEEGITSDVTLREYNLELQANVTTDAAVMSVIYALMREDVLLDEEGHMRAMSGRNVYRYNAVVRINEEADYYIIHEYYEDATGTLSRTERMYAVNILDGSTYRVTYDEKGKITLISL